MKKPPEACGIVDEMLSESCPPKWRNMINDNKPLAEAIRYFLKLKAANVEHVQHISMAWFYREKLQARFDGPSSIDTVKAYVRKFLKVDWKTGVAL